MQKGDIIAINARIIQGLDNVSLNIYAANLSNDIPQIDFPVLICKPTISFWEGRRYKDETGLRRVSSVWTGHGSTRTAIPPFNRGRGKRRYNDYSGR